VHIEPDAPACPVHPVLPSPKLTSDRERVGEATPTDPRAQRNRAGRRCGQVLTRALSPPNKNGRSLCYTPGAPVPDGRTSQPLTYPKRGQRRNPATPGILIPATNAIESLNARLRKVTRNSGQFPSEQAALKVL
jgi:hypothetical protein